MRPLLRRLAALAPSSDAPFLSIYLDVRPEATGERPALRSGEIILRDRLRDIRRTYLPRGAALDSFDADAARINAWVQDEMSSSAEGVAIFACDARGVWEVEEVGEPFENQVTAAEAPDLYQLARLDDEFETTLAAVVDTNTARIFLYRHGVLSEQPGIDDDPTHYQKRQVGGWTQAKYQRHIDNHRRDFTKEIGRAITAAVNREAARHIVLAGDPPSITPLMDQLAPESIDKVRDIVRLDLRANRNEVLAKLEPVMREVEARSGAEAIDRVVAEVRRGRLSATGADDVSQALEFGQVDELLIDDNAELGEGVRASLVRRAVATDATIETVSGSSALLALGGVAALLRYELPAP
jgi:peptide chain release factor subunit 1